MYSSNISFLNKLQGLKLRELNQKELVTIALYLLNGGTSNVDTEDIAVKAAEIAPGKFSWRKYRDNIDQELVRRALTDARQSYDYVSGSQREGWMLSPRGLKFAIESKSQKWLKPEEREPEKETIQKNKEKERLMATEAYRVFTEKGPDALRDVSIATANDFFRLNEYVTGQARMKKINRLQNLFINDQKLNEAIVILARKVQE